MAEEGYVPNLQRVSAGVYDSSGQVYSDKAQLHVWQIT